MGLSNAQLNTKVTSLTDEIAKLRAEVTSLKTTVTELDSNLAIATTVNQRLTVELDRLHQYTRRSCVVIGGIPTAPEETTTDVVKKVVDVINNNTALDEGEKKRVVNDIDKAHRIGDRKKKERAVIVRFKSHSMRTKFYYSRPKTVVKNGRPERPTVSIRPSLRQDRMNRLEAARKRIEGSHEIEFVFANAFVKRKRTKDGRLRGFYNIDDLDLKNQPNDEHVDA